MAARAGGAGVLKGAVRVSLVECASDGIDDVHRVRVGRLAVNSRAERGSGARTVARKLALQALYRWQLNACAWQDLVQEFAMMPICRGPIASIFAR